MDFSREVSRNHEYFWMQSPMILYWMFSQSSGSVVVDSFYIADIADASSAYGPCD